MDETETMSLIQVRNLGVASPRVLFQNLDFTLHPADRCDKAYARDPTKRKQFNKLSRRSASKPGADPHCTPCGLDSGWTHWRSVDTDVHEHRSETQVDSMSSEIC